MGKLRAAAKEQPETRREGIEVHFLSDKNALVFVSVDAETKREIKESAMGFFEVLAGMALYYEQAEYVAIMPPNVNAGTFMDKYKTRFKTSMAVAPQGSERDELKRSALF